MFDIFRLALVFLQSFFFLFSLSVSAKKVSVGMVLFVTTSTSVWKKLMTAWTVKIVKIQ